MKKAITAIGMTMTGMCMWTCRMGMICIASFSKMFSNTGVKLGAA